MANSIVEVDFKASHISKRLMESNKKNLELYTREVNKDTNPYVPKKTGALERSSLNNSRYAEHGLRKKKPLVKAVK